MKVILSRKGFDSQNGGYPSPILPNGDMISLPIPENTNTYYKDLMVDKNMYYLDLMNQLGIRNFNRNSSAHLDPDIKPVRKGADPWQPLFGQCGSSGSHLINNNVCKGDIFLFFGWFRNTVMTSSGLKYDPNDKNGKHIIWGYMEIGDVVPVRPNNTDPAILAHPHYVNRYESDYKISNTIYVGASNLSFNLDKPGTGVFKYDSSLVLSYDNNKKSMWKLPSFFDPADGTVMTYHKDNNRWSKNGNNDCILQSVGKGQEFVITGDNNIDNWVRNLILSNIP